MSLKQLDHLAQIAFSQEFDEFNPRWAIDGWYTDTPKYDLDKISVPVKAIYVKDDYTCDEIVN